MCQKEIKTSMGKMKNKVLPVSVLVLFMLMCINACGISKSRDSADMVSELNNRIIEKVAENYEEGNISALDIVIVRIDFGSFSQDNASEIFVLCKILNTPHVAGLDKTVGILLDADSLEMVAYKEFAADKVVMIFTKCFFKHGKIPLGMHGMWVVQNINITVIDDGINADRFVNRIDP